MQPTIIDVREPEEYATGHVNGSINIPPASLMGGAIELQHTPKDTPIVVYCRTGSRSNVALNILQHLGYTNVTNGINKEHVEAQLQRH